MCLVAGSVVLPGGSGAADVNLEFRDLTEARMYAIIAPIV
jgi:hypothetical protein